MTGPELAALRKGAHLKQAQLARLLGLTGNTTVSRWERGERRIEPLAERAILCVLGKCSQLPAQNA